MTVCIAANCANGNAVVVASDRMLSAPFLTIEFDHADAKIDYLSATCVALTAGDALAADAVLAAGPGMPGMLSNPRIEDFAEHVRQRFVEIRRRMANEAILEPRGLTFDVFYQQGGITRLPPDLAMFVDSQIQQLRLGVSIIVAGVDGAGPHVYGIEDPGTMYCWDRLGYHAVGSGQSHALLTLVGHVQHHSTGLNESVFNVYSAKRAAEIAPGVGMATEMRIITRSGVRVITPEELNLLGPIYDMRTRPQLKEVEDGIAGLPFAKEQDDGKAA